MKSARYFVGVAASVVCIATSVCVEAAEKRNLGLVGIRDENAAWLQASSNGSVRVNSTRDSQETWFLIAVDRANHVYAVANYRSGRFLAKGTGATACVTAESSSLSAAAEWKIVRGKPRVDAIGLRNVADSSLLYHSSAQHCVTTTQRQIEFEPKWGGWWDLRIAGKPAGDPGVRSILGEPVNTAPVSIPAITSL
ncbi:MAG TPA: hypothetical protein VGF18_00805 [Candidatus Tumulicola sp.]